ncbi:MAG: hypothetical protein C4B58_01575 [Deltaproteobacteria bacterium]|nr:MAG: hypothetical protein C4B58_01575 [Deltaproteobacteria bacterium]
MGIDNDREYSVKPHGKQAFTLRTLDFESNLKIVDADQFKKALFKAGYFLIITDLGEACILMISICCPYAKKLAGQLSL